jgi:hypothetical protein
LPYVTAVCGIDCFACQDEFFVNKSPLCKKKYEHALDFALRLPRLFRSRWFWAFRVQLMLSSPKACLFTFRVSVGLFPRSAQSLMLFLCRIHCKIPYTIPKKGSKHQYVHLMRELLSIHSKHMLVLSFTVASHYYNCYTDGSTNPGNYGYAIVIYVLVCMEYNVVF